MELQYPTARVFKGDFLDYEHTRAHRTVVLLGDLPSSYGRQNLN